MKVGFVLLSNSARPLPSTRIAVLNMFPFLRAAGFEPDIIFEPDDCLEQPDVSGLSHRLIAARYDVVVFQKVFGPSIENLVRELSATGVTTVYFVCDLVHVAMAEATHATVVVTEYLKQLYPSSLHHKIHIVHDGIEEPDVEKIHAGENRGSRFHPLRAVLITSASLHHLPHIGTPPDWLEIIILGRYDGPRPFLKRLRGALRILKDADGASNRRERLDFMRSPRIHCEQWSRANLVRMLETADIGILPIDNSAMQLPGAETPMWKRKSENRLTLKMAAGLPVIATPIPSYVPVIQQGINGFLAHNKQDWMKYLEDLREPEARQRIGRNARTTVFDKFSTAAQAQALVTILVDLVHEQKAGMSSS
jgi:glycosyltransferase involved in cell wall biosynthesis